MTFQFDDDAVRRMVNDAARQQADRVQKVYDHVLRVGQGKAEDDVKQLLAQKWQSTFGTKITDPELSQVAAVLAEGRRIEVKPEVS